MKPILLAAALSALSFPVVAQNNVLLILADDLGLGDVGVYNVGDDPAPTPVIDTIAAIGVRFTNAWSYPFCSPSRVALQTGRYGYRTGIGHLIHQNIPVPALPVAEITLPEMLDLGTNGAYAHAAFGKWHMGNPSNGGDHAPNIAGYSSYKGVLVGEQNQYFQWTAIHDGVPVPQTGYLTTQTADDVIDFVTNTPEPWFCFAAFHAPHTPLHAPPEALHSFNLPPVSPIIGSGFERDHFKAMVEALDTKIGEVLAAIGPALSHTTVILTSDNGTDGRWITSPPYSGQKGKGTMYEGGVNVPLIVYDPAVAEPGRIARGLVHLVDVFATVAEVAGVDLEQTMGPVQLDSTSLMPYVLSANVPGPRRTLYTEHFFPNGISGPFDYYRKAARDRRYKLIEDDQGMHFFDLVEDPTESDNLLEEGLFPFQQTVYDKLLDVLAKNGVPPPPPPPFGTPKHLPVALPYPK